MLPPIRIAEERLLLENAFAAGVTHGADILPSRARTSEGADPVVKRVLLYAPEDQFGGTAQVLLALARGLLARGTTPIVLHQVGGGLAELDKACRVSGIEVVAIPRMHGALPLRILRLASEIRAIRPDVFHLHLGWPASGASGIIAGILARVPLIVATEHLGIRIPRRSRLVHRFLSRWVSAYIAVSRGVALALVDQTGLPAARVHVILNGINVDHFAIAPSEDQQTATVDGGTVVTVARLDPQKGIQTLIRAAPRVSGVKFLIAGDGPERDKFERLVVELGLQGQIEFLGFQRDIRPLLRLADVFVLPSLYEGLPLTILEAMAARRPVIATDIPGTREVITDHVNGLLVPPNDANALASAVSSLLSDASLSLRLAREGERTVRDEFDQERMIDQNMSLYQALLGRKSSLTRNQSPPESGEPRGPGQ